MSCKEVRGPVSWSLRTSSILRHYWSNTQPEVKSDKQQLGWLRFLCMSPATQSLFGREQLQQTWLCDHECWSRKPQTTSDRDWIFVIPPSDSAIADLPVLLQRRPLYRTSAQAEFDSIFWFERPLPLGMSQSSNQLRSVLPETAPRPCDVHQISVID